MPTHPKIKLLALIASILAPVMGGGGNVRGWTEPVEIDGPLYLGAPRVVAVGETLHVIAVDPPRAWYIYSRDNGATWSEPVMPIDTSRRIEQPDLRYSDGSLHLAWREVVGFPGTWQLFHARSTDGGRSWGTPRQVFNNRTDYIAFPTLVANRDTLFVACAMYGGYPFFRSFDAGETWRDSTSIDHGEFSIIQYPRLRYSAGVLHFVYPMGIFYDSIGYEIFYSRSTDLGFTWSDRIYLSPAEPAPDYRDSQFPYASIDTAGRVLVTWMDYANGSMCGISGDIFYRVSLGNGVTWEPVGSITNTQSGENSYNLILGDKFHVAWNDNWQYGCNFPKETYSNSSDFGVTWEIPAVISGPDYTSERHTALAYTIDPTDTVLHCFYHARTEDNTSSLFYIRSRDFVSVNERGTPLPDGMSFEAYPNPFNSKITFKFTMANKNSAIEIYNIIGQYITKITLEERQCNIVWDGRYEKGGDVASGAYYATLRSGGLEKTIRITLVR